MKDSILIAWTASQNSASQNPSFTHDYWLTQGFTLALVVKNPPANAEDIRDTGSIPGFLGWEYPLEKGMATDSNILGWRIPWTEEPGRLQYMGSQSWTQLSN